MYPEQTPSSIEGRKRQRAWRERSSQVKSELVGDLYTGKFRDQDQVGLGELYPRGLSVMSLNAMAKFVRDGVVRVTNSHTGREVVLSKVPQSKWRDAEFLAGLRVEKVMDMDTLSDVYISKLFPELAAQVEREARLPTIGGIRQWRVGAGESLDSVRGQLAATPVPDGYTRIYRGIAGEYAPPLAPERRERLDAHIEQMTGLVLGERESVDNPDAAIHAAKVIAKQGPQFYSGDLEVALGYLGGLKKESTVGTLLVMDIKEKDVYAGVGGLKVSNEQTPAGYSTNIVVPRALEYAWWQEQA